MNAASIFKSTLVSLVLGSLVMFSGCSKSVSGKYLMPGAMGGSMSIDFKTSDTAEINLLGSPIPATYKIDGDKITVHPTSGNTPDLTLTIASDGSLTGPDGMKLTKQ